MQNARPEQKKRCDLQRFPAQVLTRSGSKGLSHPSSRLLCLTFIRGCGFRIFRDP
jgi:hypothetical protein